MATEAQKKARDKYNKEHYKVVSFKLHKTNDKDIMEYLESLPNKQGYLKEIIRKDMAGK